MTRPLLRSIQQKLWLRLQVFGPQTLVELCEGYQLSQVFAQQAMDELCALGMAVREGPVWRVVR